MRVRWGWGRVAAVLAVAGLLVTTGCVEPPPPPAATTELVSATSAGVAGNGDSYLDATASLSADGRYVAFTSGATDLAPAVDGNGTVDVFVRDRRTDTTILVSMAHCFEVPCV